MVINSGYFRVDQTADTMADLYSAEEARYLLKKKTLLIMGDSNMRSFYKDLIYLLAKGEITPSEVFRRGTMRKSSFCGDTIIDISPNETAGRDFFEIREFKDEDLMVRYHFITRVYSHVVQQELKAIEDGVVPTPHVVIINSCLWDITRWGAMKEDWYKEEMVNLFQHLRCVLPDDTLIIWTSTLPVATEKVKGGVFIKQLEFMKHSMRFMVLEANKFAQQLCVAFDVDFLDLHYHMRFQLHRRTNDGLHWEPSSVRHISNIILTHIALNWERCLPHNFCGALVNRAREHAEEASIENKGVVTLDEKISQYLQKALEKVWGKRGKGSGGSVTDQAIKEEPEKLSCKRVKIKAQHPQTKGRTRALGNFGIKKMNQGVEAKGNDYKSFSDAYQQQHSSVGELVNESSTSGTGGCNKMTCMEMLDVSGEVRGAPTRLLVSATGQEDLNVCTSNETQQFPGQSIKAKKINLTTSHHNIMYNPNLTVQSTYDCAGQYSRIVSLKQNTYHQSDRFNTHIPYPFWHNYPTSHIPWNYRK